MQMREGMIPSITQDEIEAMVGELAREIERDYEGKELVMICPLKGSVLFMADLCRQIKLSQVIDFVYITSPKGESCRILKDVSVNVQGKHVLIIEEIIDAGRTLSFLKARLLASYPPRSRWWPFSTSPPCVNCRSLRTTSVVPSKTVLSLATAWILRRSGATTRTFIISHSEELRCYRWLEISNQFQRTLTRIDAVASYPWIGIAERGQPLVFNSAARTRVAQTIK